MSEASSTAPQMQQVGPLPSKQGEIGYDEQMHTVQDNARASSSSPLTLPARHPADRDAAPDAAAPPPPPGSTDTPSSSSPDTSSTTTTVRRKHFLKFLDSKKIPAYWGLRLTTLLACMVQLIVIGGTAAGWVLTAKRIIPRGDDLPSQMMGSSSSIFVHVVFGIAVLGQLIFLERRIFLLRAQRYTYIHPGQILPSARHMNMVDRSDPTVAWSPWNRPPLPTYAAALAQSGVGTGDVEDHLIAQPPPPAYGNTRGSTMVLQGFLRQSLILQRPPSVHSQSSRRTSLRSAPGDRPLSYQSTDSGWQVIQDADRARQLEETLASLERSRSRASQRAPENV